MPLFCSMRATLFTGTWKLKMYFTLVMCVWKWEILDSAQYVKRGKCWTLSVDLLLMLPQSSSGMKATSGFMWTSGLLAFFCILWQLVLCHFEQTPWPSWRKASLKGRTHCHHSCRSLVRSWFEESFSQCHQNVIPSVLLWTMNGWRGHSIQSPWNRWNWTQSTCQRMERSEMMTQRWRTSWIT